MLRHMRRTHAPKNFAMWPQVKLAESFMETLFAAIGQTHTERSGRGACPWVHQSGAPMAIASPVLASGPGMWPRGPSCGMLRRMASQTRHAVRMRKRREADPNKVRRDRLRLKYGISIEEYDNLLALQGGVCGSCGRPPFKGQRLAVDHDHALERTVGKRSSVRGLVHSYPCNYVLLRKGFTPAMLRGAADYLEQAHTRTQECLNPAA